MKHKIKKKSDYKKFESKIKLKKSIMFRMLNFK